VWRSVLNDGVLSHLDPDLRLNLSYYYSQLAMERENNRATQLLGDRLRILTQPLQLDPGSRAHLIEELEEERGRFREATLISSQLLRRAESMKLQPTRQDLEEGLANSGTIKFCRAHGLPLGNNTAVY
jgi:hypothetical protein